MKLHATLCHSSSAPSRSSSSAPISSFGRPPIGHHCGVKMGSPAGHQAIDGVRMQA
jgi:hypothetical protein